MGKPETSLCEIFFDSKALKDSKRFLMIGDRLNTDILFGNRNNFQTLLVETGVHKMDKVNEIMSELNNVNGNADLALQVPDFYISRLADLFNNL
jgi:phosphoglycolate phosphatase